MNIHIFIFVCFISSLAFLIFALWLWNHLNEIGKEKTELKPMGTKTTGSHQCNDFNEWANDVYNQI